MPTLRDILIRKNGEPRLTFAQARWLLAATMLVVAVAYFTVLDDFGKSGTVSPWLVMGAYVLWYLIIRSFPSVFGEERNEIMQRWIRRVRGTPAVEPEQVVENRPDSSNHP